jgi:hypothetical protein
MKRDMTQAKTPRGRLIRQNNNSSHNIAQKKGWDKIFVGHNVLAALHLQNSGKRV